MYISNKIFENGILRLLELLLILALSSCVPYQEKESNVVLTYSREDIEKLKKGMEEIDSVFSQIPKISSIDESKTGFYINRGDSIYFYKCIADDGEHYVNYKLCNYEDILGKEGNDYLIEKILLLRKYNIFAMHYSPRIGFYYSLDVPYRSYEDSRYLFINRKNIDMSSHLLMYETVDIKDSLYLLKPK